MSTETLLKQELGLDLKKEDNNWLTECVACGRDNKMSIDEDTGKFKCWTCDFKGNAFTLMNHMTQLNSDAIWDKIKEHGLSTVDTPRKPKPAKPPIDAHDLRFATDAEIERLAESKKLSVRAVMKLNVLISRKDPEIAVLPMCRRDANNPTGGIRVRLDGKPCWYVGPDGQISKTPADGFKPVKYPMMKNTLIGLLGAKWVRGEPNSTILLCEGFKDMCKAIEAGFVATTFGGCGNWSDDCLDYFWDKEVIIIFDCDAAGQKATPKRARDLFLTAKDVSMVPPWTDVKEKDGEDVYDYLTKG